MNENDVAPRKEDWTTKELAELTGFDQSYFRHLIKDGDLQGKKRAGVWFISDSEVQRWLASRKSAES